MLHTDVRPAASHAAARIPTVRRASRPVARPPARCCRDLGQACRAARLAAGLTQRALAAKTKMRPAQVSLLEGGANVESQFYARVALALGYRSTLEMLRAYDPLTTRLLRLWQGMDEPVRALAYKKLRVWLVED